jgi:hypothetical protein
MPMSSMFRRARNYTILRITLYYMSNRRRHAILLAMKFWASSESVILRFWWGERYNERKKREKNRTNIEVIFSDGKMCRLAFELAAFVPEWLTDRRYKRVANCPTEGAKMQFLNTLLYSPKHASKTVSGNVPDKETGFQKIIIENYIAHTYAYMNSYSA